MQAETSTLYTESTSKPQRNQSKQTSAKYAPKSSNIIDNETLQLIQETINAIFLSMNLSENIVMKLQKVHVSLHNEHGSTTVTVNGKEHSLPTIKEYILKDVFTGIGTLPRPVYHIELKEDHNPVRNPPHSVPVRIQDTYKAELERFQQEDVIIEVNHYTEWVNSIVPVQKPGGHIRLCTDMRNLNVAIKRNPYYMRILDDILPHY